MVYRLRLLNARTYRLHLVSVRTDAQGTVVTPQHDRVLVIGTGGGLLWRPWQLANDQALTLASSDRIDVLLDLTGLPDTEQLLLINSAQAPFQGAPPPPLAGLLTDGDRPNRNPYPVGTADRPRRGRPDARCPPLTVHHHRGGRAQPGVSPPGAREAARGACRRA